MNPSAFYTKFFHFFLLLVLVCVSYSNTLNAPWHFDDTPNIVENDNIKIRNLSWAELKKATYFSLTENAGVHTRPVAALTFALNYLYSGNDTTSYHVVNICIHLIVSWLVYLVFFQTMSLYEARVVPRAGASIVPNGPEKALLGAVLWAIHPIHTQAVTYIVQRHALLAALFYMLAMYCYIKGRLAKRIAAALGLIALTAVFYLLGVASKQNAVVLPLALVAYEIAFFRYRFLEALRKNRVWQVVFLAGFIISFSFFVLKGKALFEYLVTGYVSRTFTMWERLITEPIVLWKYILLLLTPLSNFLTLESDMVASRSLFDPPITFVAGLMILCLILFGLYSLRRQPVLGFSIIFFFVNHMVESTFIGLELYFEHRNYLPSIFLYLALSFVLINILYFYQNQRKTLMQTCIFIFIVCYVVSDGNATYTRNDVWRNEIVLMDDAINSAPNNLRPYISASAAYMSLGKFAEAKNYLKEAEDIYKNNPNAYPAHVVGLLYYNASALYSANPEDKDLDKAINLLYKSCEVFPFFFNAHVNLGVFLFQKGNYEQAEVAFENALATASTSDLSVQFYRIYSSVLVVRGKLDEAISVLRQGLDVEHSPEVKLNLVAVYLKKGDFVQARKILFTVPENRDSFEYLLCSALLSAGAEREAALEQISTLLVRDNENYCEWLDKVKKNTLAGIVYPDICKIEDQLTTKYIEAVIHIRDEVSREIASTTECHVTFGDSLEQKSSLNYKDESIKN